MSSLPGRSGIERLPIRVVVFVSICLVGWVYFVFLKSLETNQPAGPTFRDALETQKICDAVLESAKSGEWTDVK